MRLFRTLLLLALCLQTSPFPLAKAGGNENAEASDRVQAQSVKLLASDGQQFDSFGTSVAISGDTAVVGAYGDDGVVAEQGSAYVFVRQGGTWTQQQKLLASDPGGLDGFGISVAIQGDTIVVGSHTHRVGMIRPGAAYVFVRNGTTWTEQQKLLADDGGQSGNFGSSVALSGETIVVGAQGDNSFRGAAYVFVRSGESWTQQAKLVALDGTQNSALGASVSIDGDTVITSAQQNLMRGAAYIFVRQGTSWTQQAKLTAADGSMGDEFGAFVGISGETVVATAEFDNVGPNTAKGSAYIFVRNGTSWTQQAKLTANDGDPQDIFGVSVGISGDRVIVGSLNSIFSQVEPRVSTYVFSRSGTTWTQRRRFISPDNLIDDSFGRGVAMDGGWIIVGAPTSASRGAAHVFTNASTLFDFDGDGKADQSVFRPSDGRWYLLRSQSGLTAAQFGLATDRLAPADFDGDARADIAVFRDGFWYWLNSSNNLLSAMHFGASGDVPTPADYTGDGRAELAVYRSGVWHILNLVNNQSHAVQFGIASDKPVPADFDGDGRTDIAVYRDGIWFWLRSSDNALRAVQFGLASDMPVVGDYDGDAAFDPAVYRSGVWHILRSSDNSFAVVQFGLATDVPVAADYDGDGKTDVAVFREGIWHLRLSLAGFASVQFGVATDKPLPAAFVP